MNVERPIFIIGTGRCGSTALHHLMAFHPHVAWMSGLLNQYPGGSVNNVVLGLSNSPMLGRWLRQRVRPHECYPFWETHCPGFSRPCRDLLASDVTPRSRSAIRQAAINLLTPHRKRLLAKLTGWPRIGFLHEIFPDARFINIIRDGRAVVNSLLATDFWDGWVGPTAWRFGPLEPHEQQMWESNGCSFVALAAIQWVKLVSAMESARNGIPDSQFLEVRYEELCQDSLAVMRRILSFCELPWTAGFENAIQRERVDSQNWKWNTELNAEQQTILHRVMSRHRNVADMA